MSARSFTWPLVLGFSASDSGHSHDAPWVFLVMLPLLLAVVAAGGRVFGPGFGFVLGNVAMFASAALTGGAVLDNLRRRLAFSTSTSLGFDLPRGVATALAVLLVGRPVLLALRRAARRAAFDAAPEFGP